MNLVTKRVQEAEKVIKQKELIISNAQQEIALLKHENGELKRIVSENQNMFRAQLDLVPKIHELEELLTTQRSSLTAFKKVYYHFKYWLLIIY